MNGHKLNEKKKTFKFKKIFFFFISLDGKKIFYIQKLKTRGYTIYGNSIQDVISTANILLSIRNVVQPD